MDKSYPFTLQRELDVSYEAVRHSITLKSMTGPLRNKNTFLGKTNRQLKCRKPPNQTEGFYFLITELQRLRLSQQPHLM